MHVTRWGLPLAFLLLTATVTAAPSAERLRRDTEILSSDTFEGRAPGTAGEERTVRYLIEQFQAMGLEPGNPDGTYVQEVTLAGITSRASLRFEAGDGKLEPAPINEMVAISRRLQPEITVDGSELVFVGYGAVAPEYSWDDFKDVDVRGKTVVMLINDPPVTTADGRLDPAVFRGNTMTYYGRWTYKYEIAAARGAAGCLIIHETGPAGYPFAVVSGSWGRENFDLKRPDGAAPHLALEGWITWEFAQKLFGAAGHDLADLKAAAARRDFRPVALGATASYQIQNDVREVDSKNVIALLRGRDPQLKDEYVIYTAHWDHLGRDDRLKDDPIFNGAMDNASGTAVLLEVARTFVELPERQRPPRSLLFLAVTAEEKGLLGSRHYAQNPLYPLDRTVANLNVDGANIHAPTRDIEIIGHGSTTIEDLAEPIAAARGRVLVPDAQPEKGFYYRSDHFEFANVGVPAFYPRAGREALGRPEGYIEERRAEYTTHHYHKPSDEVQPGWDFEAVAQDAQFLFDVGRELATRPEWPEWKAGSEFKARRDAMLAQPSR